MLEFKQWYPRDSDQKPVFDFLADQELFFYRFCSSDN
jgi:hypothetical protein